MVPGRLQRPDPRSVRTGSASVCELVPPRPRRATVTWRLCTIAGFYRYAVEEDLLDHSPAAHVRRPRLDYESHATGPDRNELGALLVACPRRHRRLWGTSRNSRVHDFSAA
jgi:site-specific recombinase XerD